MGKLEDAIEFLDIQDWLDQYVEVKGGGVGEVRIKECPKCFNDKWKVYINTEKKRWFCQRCQWGKNIGDPCVLLAAVSGLNVHAVRMELMSSVIPSVADEDFMGELANKLNDKAAGEEFHLDPIDLPGEEGFPGVMGERAKNYLLSRGLSLDDISRYKLRLSNKLRNSMGPWAVFPVFYYDIPVACQGRKFSSNVEPRYLSSDKIANWMWPLDDESLKSIEDKEYVVLVEGVFDALAYSKAGIPALCTFGKNLSRNQIKLLKSHKIKSIYLSYDADAHKDIMQAADRIGHLFHTHIIELSPLPDNPKADPGDVLAGKVAVEWLLESFEQAIDTKTDAYWRWKLKKELEK